MQVAVQGDDSMVNGAHVIVFSRDAMADRAFFKEVLGLGSVDAGGHWLIFALPPAELAVHPDERGARHELYLQCEDIDATLRELKDRGVKVERAARDPDWGKLASITLPGGGELGIYEPRHPLATEGST